jgi:hypothetical protein
MAKKVKAIYDEYEEIEGRYFSLCAFIWFSEDYTAVRCRHCPKTISKGPAGTAKKNLTTAGMENHLKAMHPEAAAACAAKDLSRKQVAITAATEAAERNEVAGGQVKMFNLRTQEERSKFLDMVRPSLCCSAVQYS